MRVENAGDELEGGALAAARRTHNGHVLTNNKQQTRSYRKYIERTYVTGELSRNYDD